MKLYQYELQFDSCHKIWTCFNDTSQRMRYKSLLLSDTWAESCEVGERIDMFMCDRLFFAQRHVTDRLPYFKHCGWFDFVDPNDGRIGYAIKNGGLRVFMTEEDDPQMIMHELDKNEIEEYLLKFMEITEAAFNAGIQPRCIENDYIVRLDPYENNV